MPATFVLCHHCQSEQYHDDGCEVVGHGPLDACDLALAPGSTSVGEQRSHCWAIIFHDCGKIKTLISVLCILCSSRDEYRECLVVITMSELFGPQ